RRLPHGSSRTQSYLLAYGRQRKSIGLWTEGRAHLVDHRHDPRDRIFHLRLSLLRREGCRRKRSARTLASQTGANIKFVDAGDSLFAALFRAFHVTWLPPERLTF